MRHILLCSLLLLLAVSTGSGQNVGYIATTVAGAGHLNEGGSALNAYLRQPLGVAVDPAGNIYISDALDNRVRKVTAGLIATVAGNGIPGYLGDGGPATSASLDSPGGIALDSSGNLYIADRSNHVIRRVSPDGIIRTVAANTDFVPQTVALDDAGNLYIADNTNFRVWKLSPSGTLSTVAGNGTESYSGDNGPAPAAGIGIVLGLATDSAGNIYISPIARISWCGESTRPATSRASREPARSFRRVQPRQL